MYDSYVCSETMAAYGIDNLEQERYLEQQGFEVYPHTYSIGAATLQSMTALLDCSYVLSHDDPRRAVSGGGMLQA